MGSETRPEPSCPDCGRGVDPGDAYCQHCGAALGQTDEAAAAAPTRERDADGGVAAPSGSDPGPEQSGGDEGVASDTGTLASPRAYTAGRKVAIGGAAVAVAGAFLPWISVSLLGSTVTRHGIEADGAITLVLALLAGGVGLLWWGRRTRIAVGVLGTLVGGIGLLYITDPTAGVSMTPAQRQFARAAFEVGTGLYLTALGGAMLVAGAGWRLVAGGR